MDSRVLNEYWRQRVLKQPDKRVVAEHLGISYYTLNNKLNGYGKFTEKQMEKLNGLQPDRTSGKVSGEAGEVRGENGRREEEN